MRVAFGLEATAAATAASVEDGGTAAVRGTGSTMVKIGDPADSPPPPPTEGGAKVSKVCPVLFLALKENAFVFGTLSLLQAFCLVLYFTCEGPGAGPR